MTASYSVMVDLFSKKKKKKKINTPETEWEPLLDYIILRTLA